MTTTPQQYDAMAGDILGRYSYSSKHNGDDTPPDYTAQIPATTAHKDAHGHTIKAVPAHEQHYTGAQIAAAFKAKYGYIYES